MTTLTILGSGTSTGVPLIQCKCLTCRSKNPRNQRLRASVWIQTRGKSFLVDTSPDLRAQALRARIPRIDAVLYTHPHADHISGIDELRSFNFIQKEEIPVYGNSWTWEDLNLRYQYIFKPSRVEGGGIPRLKFHLIPSELEEIQILGVPVLPLPVLHGSQTTLGFRIDSVAYLTDCSYIPTQVLDRLQGLGKGSALLLRAALRVILRNFLPRFLPPRWY